jgi:AcrR family transcriptional regulator
VSRPTLYAHYKTIGDVVEAVVARAVQESTAAIAAAEPQSGPPLDALERLVAASWARIAHFDAVAHGAREHISAAALNRAHAPVMGYVRELVLRGQADGTFRKDLPADWLVTTYFALVHGAADVAGKREEVLALLQTSLRDLFTKEKR